MLGDTTNPFTLPSTLICPLLPGNPCNSSEIQFTSMFIDFAVWGCLILLVVLKAGK